MAVESARPPSAMRTPRQVLLGIGIEAIAVVVAVFLAVTAAGHIAQTVWAGTFLDNADSLALPLIEQSILRGEPFHWVFSSQNYLFPEGPLFFISALFAQSARVAMYVNACLNVVALYLLLRSIAHNLAHRSRHRLVEILIAVGATGLFVIFVLLEPTAAVNAQGVATLFLFSTYYSGVIISGLAVVALTLWVSRAFGSLAWGRNRVIVYAVVVAVVTALTAFSDPLYFLQVVVPLAGAASLLVLVDRISWRGFLILAAPTAVGCLVAVGLRLIFSKSFASGAGAYISFANIPQSVHLVIQTFREMLHTRSGALTLVLLGGVLLVNGCVLLYALYAQARPRLAAGIATSEVFIVTFVATSFLTLFSGLVLTGSTTTRYLEPLYIFPLLTVVSVGVFVLRRLLVGVHRAELRQSLSRFALTVSILAALVVVVVGVDNFAPIAKSASGAGYTGAACFDNFVGDSKINGVGSYWTVRPLALYGTSKGAILQADDAYGRLEVFAWINNLGSYGDKKFSYVVTDASGQIAPGGLVALGRPAQVISCPGYLIYDYRGTHGEKILTKEIAASARQILITRRGQ